MGHGGAPCPSAGDGTDIWEDTELVHDDTDKHTDGNIPELVEDVAVDPKSLSPNLEFWDRNSGILECWKERG